MFSNGDRTDAIGRGTVTQRSPLRACAGQPLNYSLHNLLHVCAGLIAPETAQHGSSLA